MKKVTKKMTVKPQKEKSQFCPFSADGECKTCDCELWLGSVYSTENIIQKGRCSIRFLAEKNSEGLLPV